MSHNTSPLVWDIFCNVIDNYGDIGVAWRLARQLHIDHGQQIRLWVDDLASFARLCPELKQDQAEQQLNGISVRHWTTPFVPGTVPGDVVVDAFGCSLPENFLLDMAARTPAPMWINLEYLSAEDWIECCHGMISPHPALPLERYFYFPGFNDKTGGVLAERGLDAAVHSWRQNPARQQAWWQSLGLPPRQNGELIVSLFAYENQAVGELLHLWAEGTQRVRCLAPEGRILPDIATGLGLPPLCAGDCIERGALTLYVLPFSDQPAYDRLLWSCDINFVRGEDSFMRAQWAGKPFVWHIYPQQEAAHWVKLDAFWSRYAQGLDPAARTALMAVNHAWNHGQNMAAAWSQFEAQRPALEAHAEHWPQTLLVQGDLVSRLMRFVSVRRKES